MRSSLCQGIERGAYEFWFVSEFDDLIPFARDVLIGSWRQAIGAHELHSIRRWAGLTPGQADDFIT